MAAFIGPAISAATSIFGSLAGRNKNPKIKYSTPPETDLDRTKKDLINEILSSLKGNGPYSDLFSPNEDVFQKSIVEPAMSRFQNQIAPQIQQSYIASGQQRNTGLEDTLARAGVDLDQMINEQYMNFYQNAQNMRQNAIGNILGQQGPQPQAYQQAPQPSFLQSAGQGLSGYASGTGFKDDLSSILDYFGNRKKQQQSTRTGFESPSPGGI